MISGRMLSVFEVINQKHQSTFKELAELLDIKERHVRYDIDRINDVLSRNDLPTIQKLSKGQLVIEEEIDLQELIGTRDFLYTQEERTALLLLTLLVDEKSLRLNHLSEHFQVSRSTIKNDLATLEKQLYAMDIEIEYIDGHFKLFGEKIERVSLMNEEFKKYVYILRTDKTLLNMFETSILEMFKTAFAPVSLEEIIDWINDLLTTANCMLTDQSYDWYVANIFVLIWFVLHDKRHPLEEMTVKLRDELLSNKQIEELNRILNISISQPKQAVMMKLLNYTNKYGTYDNNVNLIYVESVVSKLITKMSAAMEIEFAEDNHLIEGLINHMTPLLSRLRENVNVYEELNTMLSTKDTEVYEIVKEVVGEIDTLTSSMHESDIIYIAIHFLSSIERMTKNHKYRVLLVCGFGYGTTTLLKENLINEFQVDIVKAIPHYYLESFTDWDKIDLVISTSRIKEDIPKNHLIVNPILTESDFSTIESHAIPRRKIISNYYAIEEKLHFLSTDDKEKVLEILQDELGYKNIPLTKINKKFSDLVQPQNIRIVDEVYEWKQAVRETTQLLERSGVVEPKYAEDIIETMEELGFYSVTDEAFAMFHGKSEDVYGSAISLIVNRQPIFFDEKEVKILFSLSSKNKKDHIDSLITLTRLVKTTDFIERLEKAESVDEIYELILTYEKEVTK